MADLPTGTVTFVFTDLEVSTRLWDLEPEAMRVALARHDEILRDTVDAHGGHVVKGRGDGVHAVFATADAAVHAAIDCELAMAAEIWPVSEPLRARIGIHTGVAQLREGDYFGSAVNRAARLEGIAHGGQIVCSQATADLAGDLLSEGVVLVDLGEHRLRDLSRAERVFQVSAPGLQGQFGPLASVDAFPGNLPLQVSSFIGREREIVRTVEALESGRLVTLTGVGGVGKTRLAYQAAAEVLPRFREGAWLVELAGVRDPDGVTDAFAAVFRVLARAGQSIEDALVEFLQNKQLLLVVDNCEHVLDAVADVIEAIMGSCARVVVLATSREGLALDGERIFAVPALAAPAEGADLATVGAANAVQLFVERAQGVDADFALDDANAAAVGQVCRRLDGVPLAIELAAARVTAMTPGELAVALDHRFDLLAGGRRRAVKRQQTLRATIDWSYDLLDEPQQRLLARLSVFAGGCTREAADAVCAGAPIESRAVFGLLTGLVDRSLVVAERGGPDTRYRLLETIREYGEERLGEHGETEASRARHAEYFTEFARLAAEQIEGPHQIDVGRRLAAERENLLAAMQHAIDRDDSDLALRLLHNTGFGVQLGKEFRLPVDDALDLTDAPEHPLYPYALAIAANYAASRGEPDRAEAFCEQSLAATLRLGDPNRSVELLLSTARVALAQSIGAWADAATQLELGAEIARATGQYPRVASNLGGAAMMRTMAGDPARALQLATEGLAAARQLGTASAIILNLDSLAGALADQDPERAKALVRESLQLGATLGYEQAAEATQRVLVTAKIGDWPLVLKLAPVSIRHIHWNSDWLYLGGILNVVARALAPLDAEAAAVLQGAARRLATAATSSLAPPAHARSRPGPTIDQHADTASGRSGFLTELRRTTTGLLHDTLGEARLRELRAEGDAMDNDHTVAYALDAIDQATRRQNAPRRDHTASLAGEVRRAR